jgi:hypothetical protein
MDIAIQRIYEWKEGTILNLSDLELTSLPDNLPARPYSFTLF